MPSSKFVVSTRKKNRGQIFPNTISLQVLTLAVHLAIKKNQNKQPPQQKRTKKSH